MPTDTLYHLNVIGLRSLNIPVTLMRHYDDPYHCYTLTKSADIPDCWLLHDEDGVFALSLHPHEIEVCLIRVDNDNDAPQTQEMSV